MNKKLYSLLLVLIALLAGFGVAFLTAGVQSYFFVLMPLLAFFFGYFSSWKWGLFYGFLLFAAYTSTLTLIWRGNIQDLLYPIPGIVAFVGGGFSFCLVGTLAPFVRKRYRSIGGIAGILFLVAIILLCGYMATTRYEYYYQVVFQSTEDLNGVELYLPVGTVQGKVYADLYDRPLRLSANGLPTGLTGNFTQTVIDTPYGKMLKIEIPRLTKLEKGPPVSSPGGSSQRYDYTGNIIFSQVNVPHEEIQIEPKQDVVSLNTLASQRFFGPVKQSEGYQVEKFQVPVKVVARNPARFKISITDRTDQNEATNFGYFTKSKHYTERAVFEGEVKDDWIFITVEADRFMEISIPSD